MKTYSHWNVLDRVENDRGYFAVEFNDRIKDTSTGDGQVD